MLIGTHGCSCYCIMRFNWTDSRKLGFGEETGFCKHTYVRSVLGQVLRAFMNISLPGSDFTHKMKTKTRKHPLERF